MSEIIHFPSHREQLQDIPSLDSVLDIYQRLANSPNAFERDQACQFADQVLPLCQQLLACAKERKQVVIEKENLTADMIRLEKSRATSKELEPIINRDSTLREDNSDLAVERLTLVTRIRTFLLIKQGPATSIHDRDGTESLPQGVGSDPRKRLEMLKKISLELKTLGVEI